MMVGALGVGAADRRAEQRGATGLHRHQRDRRFRHAPLDGLRASCRSRASSSSPRSLFSARCCASRPSAATSTRSAATRRRRGCRASTSRASQDRRPTAVRAARGHRRRAVRRRSTARASRCRRRARARRDRRRRDRRHQPDGRRGGLGGTLVGVLIFGLLSQHPAAAEHQLERSAGDEGADHRRHRAGAGAQSRPSSWRDRRLSRSPRGRRRSGNGRANAAAKRREGTIAKGGYSMKRREFLKLSTSGRCRV